MPIVIKSPAELDMMWEANQVVRQVLSEIGRIIRPGLATSEIGELATQMAHAASVVPAFLGYGDPPFPSPVCVSVNDAVVHGIPSAEEVLKCGDIVSVDFGVEKAGYFGDSAYTFAVDEISPVARRLLDVTKAALERAIEACVIGNRISDIGARVQEHVEANGFSVVRVFVGHGIGRAMHEEPSVPNYVAKGRNPRLRDGMVLAIEPMVNVGDADIVVDADRWTARSRDGSLSAHFEHSVAITKDGPWVLSGNDCTNDVASSSI